MVQNMLFTTIGVILLESKTGPIFNSSKIDSLIVTPKFDDQKLSQ